MNKIDSKEKISLREFMEQKEFKNFQFLRLYINQNWNSEVFMDNRHYKCLLDWKNKDYVSDEKGDIVLDDSYYLGEYDNYLVQSFDTVDNICLSLMITLSEQEENFNFNLPKFTCKVPKIDKNTNLLFGNGITLEILKNSEFKKDYYMDNIIFRSLQVEKFKEYFDGKKLELNLHLHSLFNNECKKYKTLPIIKSLNANKNGNLFDLSTDVFYAYKYGYIDDIEDEDYIQIFIGLLKEKIMNNNFTEDTCFDLTKNIAINSNDYNKDNITSFIKNTKKEFRKMMWEIARNNNLNFEIINYILENEINHESLKLIEKRVNNYENDFESWFIYSNLSRELMHLTMETIVDFNNSSITKDMVKEILKNYSLSLKNEELLKYFLLFSLLNYKKDSNSFVSIDYNPEPNNYIKKITNEANKIMTLNYDNFLEKISSRNDIYHLHGRFDKIFDSQKKKMVDINTENLHKYFLRLVELTLIGFSPRTKRNDYLFYDFNMETNDIKLNKEYKTMKDVQNFLNLQEILKANSERKKDDINLQYLSLNEETLSIDLLRYNIYKNKKIVLIGINPLGDLFYLIDLIINYDEIYVSYYSVEDRENLLKTVTRLFNYISKPIHSFYHEKMSIIINRLDKFKIYYFDVRLLYQ